MIIDNIDPKTVRGSVGQMLREERLAHGLSFEQAADAARVSKPHASNSNTAHRKTGTQKQKSEPQNTKSPQARCV